VFAPQQRIVPSDRVRELFRKKVAGLDRFAGHVIRPPAPHAERTARVFVPTLERPPRAPQREQLTPDLPASGTIALIMRAIELRRGSILLADRLRVRRIRERADIFSANGRVEHVRRRPQPDNAASTTASGTALISDRNPSNM
jgi:hypothetical protein